MKVYVPLFLSVFLLVTNVAYSQNDTITTKIITFEDGDFSEMTPVNESNYIRNIIKLNPLLFINGDIPVYYERTLNAKSSLEVGLGFTLRNYWSEIRESIEYNEIDESRIKHVARPSLKLGARYYPAGYAPEEWYFALEYAYRAYGQEITTLKSDGSISSNKISGERIYNEVKLIVGGQMESRDGFWYDLYMGVGLRAIDITEVEEIRGSNATGSFYEYDLKHRTDVVPAFYLGIKIGVGF